MEKTVSSSGRNPSVPVPATSDKRRAAVLRPLRTIAISLSALVLVFAVQYASELAGFQPATPELGLVNYHCNNAYNVEILSFDPVVMYLNDFISEFEIDHLLKT